MVDQAQSLLASWKVPIAKTVVARRLQYANAITAGRTGAEKDRKAEAEIDALWGEVLSAVRRGKKK